MAKARKIDFSGVDQEIRGGGGKAAHVPDGDYLLKIVKGDFVHNEESGKRYYNWRFSIVKPEKYKGKTVYDITSLKPDALWNLRNLIHAATGKNVAGKAVNFDPEKLEGKIVAATLEAEEYKKKFRSRPIDYRPKSEWQETASDEDDESDDDEEEEVEEEETEEEDEDLEDVDVEDL